jgi:hypothetical protein
VPNEAGSSELDGFIRALLILLGIGVGVWAMWQWIDTGKGVGPRTTVTEATSPGPIPGESPAPTSQVVVTTKEHKHGSTTTTSTFGGPTSKTSTTAGPSIRTHSDAITLALLGISLLLLLSGMFWGRVQSISAGGVAVAFRSTAATADKTTKWLAALDRRVRGLPSRDALNKTNEQVARLTSRVEALEQGRPLEEIARSLDQYILSRPQLAEMTELAEEPHPEETELERLRADADRAVAELRQRVEELRD